MTLNCLLCYTEMDPVNAEFGTHPGCDMKLLPVDDETDPFAEMLKTQIINMVRWAEEQNPRSQQVLIGPSEIGALCDRRIGYRIAGMRGRNTEFDPWPAIMGTAIHSWLDDAVSSWMDAHGSQAWWTETKLIINDFVEGHADLFWREEKAVVDYKSAGPDIMRKVRKDGPPIGYQIQTHVYGYGFEQLGYQVDRVCLVFLPRAGWLKDTYVWCAPYNRDIAKGAMIRVRLIAQKLLELGVLTDGNESAWDRVESFPSNDCGWCPFYDPGRDPERGADDTGCPGR